MPKGGHPKPFLSPKNMKSPRLAYLLPLMSLLLALEAAAQTPTPTPVKVDDDVIKVESRLVVVPVSVTDESGNPVTGLTNGDFRVTEEGRVQKLESFGTADRVPLDIALLFDVSASTDKMFKFELDTAAKFLKDVMRSEDRATIYTIGMQPIQTQGRDTADRSVTSLLSLQPTKGATAFFDTVRAAAEYLRKNTPEGRRKVILVISDGEDNYSEAVQRAGRLTESKIVDGNGDPDYKKLGSVIAAAQERTKTAERARVVRALQDADTVFYSINPGGSSFQLNKISVFGQENMQRFAGDTGGTAFLPKFQPVDTKDNYQNENNARANSQALDRIFKQLSSELRAQYLVQYYSEADFPANKYVKVDVSVQNHGAVKVRAREGYFVKK